MSSERTTIGSLQIEISELEHVIRTTDDDRDSLRMVVRGLQDELRAKDNAAKIGIDLNELLRKENEELKQVILNIEPTIDKLRQSWKGALDDIDNLAEINGDMDYDITNLSESLLREQRIVDFLTGQYE